MGGIILVGVDDTGTALLAAEKAASFAVSLELELHVVSAYDSSEVRSPLLPAATSSSQVDPVMEEHRKKLSQLRKKAQDAANSVVEVLRSIFPELIVQGRAVEGAPGPTLIRESRELGAEMVVVGNRNVQGFARLLGSIATTVAREIDCDLHIVNTRSRN